MVDARGVEIPYVDRDGNELKTVKERYYPAKGQKFFLKGGVIDNPKYEYRGPETLPFDELMRRGYQLPFYADLSRMPDADVYKRQAQRAFSDMELSDEDREYLRLFAFVCELSFDVYLKKQMIEKLTDQLREERPPKKGKKKS